MASVRDLNRRISSLHNMKKVMSAMNMIASTKFSRLLQKQAALVKFTAALEVQRRALSGRLAESGDILITGNGVEGMSHLVVFTADRGLCGSHNSSVLKAAGRIVRGLAGAGRSCDITAIGIKGRNYCRKRELALYHSADISEKTLQDADLLRIASDAVARYRRREIGELTAVYNRFVSALVQQTVVEKLLPLTVEPEHAGRNRMSCDLPDDQLIPDAAVLLVFYRLKSALSNSYISEYGARMTAMENASSNSQGLIDRYGAIRNRVRQTAITNELTEIVSGTEAMKK